VLPLAIWGSAIALAGRQNSVTVNFLLSIVIVAPIGLYLYRIAYQPIAHASVLVLLIASVGVHLALQGLGLAFFGAEGLRAPAIATTAFTLGPLRFTGQSIAIYAITVLLIVGLWLLFGYTLTAGCATAVNRLAHALSASAPHCPVRSRSARRDQWHDLGILIVPITTIYYDTGFLIGLKGFVAAIIGGLVSYPLTAVAALVVGTVEAFSSFYASNFKEVIVFTLLLPVLIQALASLEVEEEED
jgi:branched-chain amino acid transport system permease protein